jgi:hypothetical protein
MSENIILPESQPHLEHLLQGLKTFVPPSIYGVPILTQCMVPQKLITPIDQYSLHPADGILF